ncbi:MAG TPA: O-antigen ligase family protein [Solirubrobacterales bacterium]|nr:O-antigen ligase family protein [Solirubrobacterales bacterium]
MAEADRVLVYLGVFLAAFLLAQTDQRRQRFGEGIAIAIAGVVLLALASRLLPHVFDISHERVNGSRLRYPLGYWNAIGLFGAMATVFGLWMSRRSLVPWLRWFAAAAIPPILLALYLTYSRGGILVLVVCVALLLALSPDRLWMLVTMLCGVLGTVPAVLYVGAHNQIANNVDEPGLVEQGLVTLLLILAGAALALLLFWALRRAERERPAPVARLLEISRDRRVLRGIGIAVLVLLVVFGVAFGARAWDRFTSADLVVSARPGEHFGEVSSGGRVQFWEVALKAFGEEPLLGQGAGTYQFSWNQHRPLAMPVRDAHSLYLQPLAELGILGGVLVVAMVLFLLGVGFLAWRAASGRQRELYAVLLSVSLAFALGAAFDWFWQIAVVGSVFFLATAALVAARCSQIWRAGAFARARAGIEEPPPDRRRFGLAIAGLAVAWLTMLALIGPLLVDREIDQSTAAILRGEVENAVSHAESARSIEPWAATPYRQLGLLAEAKGEYAEAIHRFGEAIDREDRNWSLYFLRARAEHKAGQNEAAHADLEEAKRLNPLETCLSEGFEGCE